MVENRWRRGVEHNVHLTTYKNSLSATP